LGHAFDAMSENYDSIAMGADLFNFFLPANSKGCKRWEDFYLSFENLILINRPGFSLSSESYNYARDEINILQSETSTMADARKIREAYVQGKDIRSSVPDEVWPLIKNHVINFQNQK